MQENKIHAFFFEVREVREEKEVNDDTFAYVSNSERSDNFVNFFNS